MRLHGILMLCLFFFPCLANAQTPESVSLIKSGEAKQIDIYIGPALFTRFFYPDTLEKPVLFPIYDAANVPVTRGFPKDPRPGDPTDHPHHLGLWLTYENVNGLDFWNNSYAIPAEKKSLYGWIKTDRILEMSGGQTGKLTYHANWVNQQNEVLISETTHFEFSGRANERIIDRVTELKAVRDITFTDAKDGFLGLRLAHELEIPGGQRFNYTDNKGNSTVVKKDPAATGNYVTSEGKLGDSVWSTRAAWCKVYGKIGNDSVSITIFDHPANIGYPTFWHARGYGLFAANPLGEKIFTNGRSELNLKLKKDSTIVFRYRILIQNGPSTPSPDELNHELRSFSNKN
jgi:Methane oxygenase PmoA